MILGSLKEIIGLHEDGVTARRRKAINRARKDPNTKVGIIYDGRDIDYYNKLKEIGTNKERKKIGMLMQYKTLMDPNFSKINSDKKATYNYEYDVYRVNKNSNIPDLINIRGNINYKHPIMKHEIQHDIQQRVIKAVAKQYDHKANQKIDQINQKIGDYDDNISRGNTERNYYKNPTEFEANIAGSTGNPHPSKSTVRLARNILGKSTPKPEFLPTYSHGKYAASKVATNSPYSLQQRQKNNSKEQTVMPNDRKPRPGEPNMNKENYNKRAQQIIDAIKVPSRVFNSTQMDSVKGMSKNPKINKSLNFPKSK